MHSQDTRTPRQNQRLAEILEDRAAASAEAVARSARGLNALVSTHGVPENPTVMLEQLHMAVDQLRSVLMELHMAAGLDPFLGRRVRGYAFGAASLLNDALICIGLIHARAGERELDEPAPGDVARSYITAGDGVTYGPFPPAASGGAS